MTTIAKRTGKNVAKSAALAALMSVCMVSAGSAVVDVEKGRAIYDARCVGCHSRDLKESAAMAKKLKVKEAAMDLTSREVRDKKDAVLLAVILEGASCRPPDPAQKLTSDDAENVLAYVRTLRGLVRGYGKRAKGDAGLAAKNFYAAQCIYCHGENGKGNVGIAEIFKVDKHSIDLTSPEAQALKDEELAAIISDGKGRMPGFSARLTPEEIRAMVALLRKKGGGK